MKRSMRFALLVAMALMMCGNMSTQAAPAELFSPRGGLSNFLHKLQTRNEVAVAFLGGSITGANGWRPKITAWLQLQNPNLKIREVNAAIPGTGSTLGVYRLHQDVLRHKPDLLFVEFAVNDGGTQPEDVARAMEGIVRQARRSDPTLDLCFVYTFRTGHEKYLKQRKCPPAAAVHEAVAAHYEIPSINLGVRVVEEAQAGKLQYRVAADESAPDGVQAFSTDGIHPGEVGHSLYAEVITAALQQLPKESNVPLVNSLPAPLRADNWEDAHLVSPSRAILSDGWQRLDETHPIRRRFQTPLSEIYEATQPRAKISFSFKGTHAALYDICAPDAGQIIVTIDGETHQTLPRLEAVTSYPRLSILPIASGLPDTLHTVSVEIHPDEPDRSAIIARESKKPNYRPELYHGIAMRIGAIMLIGELKPQK